MSNRDRFLALADRLRSIAGPTTLAGTPGFDVRQNRVIVRRRTWSSGKIQTGTATVADLEILPRPHVTGAAGDPVLTVGPITPAYPVPPAGGYTPAQLNPADSPGLEWTYVVIGPDGVERAYKSMRFTNTKPLRYMLELTSLDRVVPF